MGFMRNLRDLLKQNGLTPRSLARLAETPEAHLHCLLSRTRRPSVDLAQKMETVTGGAIPWTVWFEKHENSPTAA